MRKCRLPVNILPELLDRLDAVTKKLSETSGYEVTRTAFVEKAIRNAVSGAEDDLRRQELASQGTTK